MAKLAQNPRIKPPMSAEQRAKLSAAQKAYIEKDPRWIEHRCKLAEAQKKPDQRLKLSAAQLAYMANDPRWPDHESRHGRERHHAPPASRRLAARVQ
jgi:hypothetical protein